MSAIIVRGERSATFIKCCRCYKIPLKQGVAEPKLIPHVYSYDGLHRAGWRNDSDNNYFCPRCAEELHYT